MIDHSLYHFCSDQHLPGILKRGLTLGRVCWLEKGIIHSRSGYQWLTSNPERAAQEWCQQKFSSLPYDRCANRLTIEIPADEQLALARWVDEGPLMVPPDQLRVLNMFGDPREYFLFLGDLPARWITKVEKLGARWGAGEGQLIRTRA